MPYIIIGKIIAPHSDRREIGVNKKSESHKLPFDAYPITHKNTPEGMGVTLISGVHQCDASLHRYKDSFYIGSATKRLRSSCAEEFRKFLERGGVIEPNASVRLRFEGYRIDVDRIK